MKKDELMLDYARSFYRERCEAKKDIRNRSYLFYGLGIPVFSTLFVESIKRIEVFDCLHIIFLLSAGKSLCVATVFFILIMTPSPQRNYLPTSMVSDIVNFDKTLLDNKNDVNVLTVDQKESLTYEYFFNAYSDCADEYDKTNKRLQVFFLIMAVAEVIAFSCLLLSFLK